MSNVEYDRTPIPANAFYVEIVGKGAAQRFYPQDVADMGHTLSKGCGSLSIYLPLAVDNAVNNPLHTWWLAVLGGDTRPRDIRVVYERQGHTLTLTFLEARTIQHRFANITGSDAKAFITEVLVVTYKRCDSAIISNGRVT